MLRLSWSLPFPTPLDLDLGETYVIHVRADGANDDNNLFTKSRFPVLMAGGDSFGLYLPSEGFGSSSAIADYIGWGAGGQPRESVAFGAGIWSAGGNPGRPPPGWSASAPGVSPPPDQWRRWENPAPHGVSLAGPPAGRPRSARGDG